MSRVGIFDVPSSPRSSDSRPSSSTPVITSQSLNPDALDFEPTQPSSLPHPPDINPPAANTPPHPDQFTVPTSSDSQSLNASKDTSNDETSQFNKKWSSTFAANSSWQEFSEQCDLFAKEVILECDKNFQNKKKAVPRRPLVLLLDLLTTIADQFLFIRKVLHATYPTFAPLLL